jgi:site-specific DNA-methyltransferase (adenine-specific)
MTVPDESKVRAPRNRTLVVDERDIADLQRRLLILQSPVALSECLDRTIYGDCLEVLPMIPASSVDLAIVDPPYNLAKTFGSSTFRPRNDDEYESWIESWLRGLAPLLKPQASLYVCCDWRSSGPVQRALARRFVIRNRITWEREKGRGAMRNWKNSSEDIWFCTVGSEHHFDVDAVKSKRRVVAPYRDQFGRQKDWVSEAAGDFRMTHPSNFWGDISIPFWSMPENTDHPTQKPEKLIAKLVLASSRPGDLVIDPFLGSGTTSVVAKKLGRHFIGIEAELPYCLLAEKRLQRACQDPSIQGYEHGVFLERNTLALQERQLIRAERRTTPRLPSGSLLDAE